MQCTQCQSLINFTDKDRELLKQVSPSYNGVIYQIPDPTLCWQCKLQNRLSFRNERSLYKRKCDFSSKDIVSIYSPDKPYKVYHQDIWWSDDWDALEYGRDFDFSRPFFEQFEELLHEVPLMALWLINPQNAAFNNNAFDLKDSYMNVNSDVSERLFYCYGTDHSNDVMDSTFIKDSQLVYECVDGEKLYRCFYSQNLSNCSEVYFSSNLSGCKYCFGCNNLRGKEYYIFNEPVSKEQWEEKMSHFKFTTTSIQESLNQLETIQKNQPRRSAIVVNCENSTGNHLYHSKDLENCYDVRKSENAKNVLYGPWGVKNTLDAYAVGDNEWCYEIMGGGVGTNQNAFLMNFANGPSSSYYSVLLLNGTSDCFGSIGLKHKQYCVLNKQYSKENYEELVPKIIEHMQSTNEWGQFFPYTISMFGYNETKAQELFPLTKEEALNKGYKWSDYEKPKQEALKTIQAHQLPENIEDIPDDILNWAILCEETGEPYKIIKPELALYKKLGLPIPRKSPDVRNKRRNDLRDPFVLRSEKCDHCGKGIQTAARLDGLEKVYCQECYLSAIY